MLNTDIQDLPNSPNTNYDPISGTHDLRSELSDLSRKPVSLSEDRGIKKFRQKSKFFGNIFGEASYKSKNSKFRDNSEPKPNPNIMKSKYPTRDRKAIGDEAPMFSRTVFNPKTKFVGTVQGGFYKSSKNHMKNSNANYRLRQSFSTPGVKLPFNQSVYSMATETAESGMANNKKFDMDILNDTYKAPNPLSGQ